MTDTSGSGFWPTFQTHEAPVWVAPHSPISRFDIDRQVDLYREYADRGAALLVTGEIAPGCPDLEMKGPVIRIRAACSERGDPEAFYLFGPPYPNFIPAEVGIELVKKTVSSLAVPLVANIGDVPEGPDGIEVLRRLADAGAAAFEIALSCPNLHRYSQDGARVWLNESLKIVETIRELTGLPIALKIRYAHLRIGAKEIIESCWNAGVDQLSIFDALKAICPPDISGAVRPPYRNFPALSFGGASGPWGRYLLFTTIALMGSARASIPGCGISLSAVGGILNLEHVIELVALGADSVQLSSVVMWEGFKSISRIVDGVKAYRAEHWEDGLCPCAPGFKPLPVYDSAAEGLTEERGEKYWESWMADNPVSRTDYRRCIKCGICCENPCLARTATGNRPTVKDDLCSGCGWCAEICPVGAIDLVERESPGKAS